MFQQRISKQTSQMIGGKLTCRNFSKWNELVALINSISVEWYSQNIDGSDNRGKKEMGNMDKFQNFVLKMIKKKKKSL